MFYQGKIEQCLNEIKELEKTFCEAQDREILPLSFFSSTIDILIRLKTGIYEIEAAQLQMMQEHLNKRDEESWEIIEPEESIKLEEPSKSKKTEELEKLVESEEPVILKPSEDKSTGEKSIPSAGILEDTIVRKINTDFGKSLSLNDRFMFQRDLFQGNADEMNRAFTQLNVFQSLNEVLAFLNDTYAIPWNSDSGIVLKELLDKRFA
jgi:hypothetical protein